MGVTELTDPVNKLIRKKIDMNKWGSFRSYIS